MTTPKKRNKIKQGRRGPFSNDEKRQLEEFYETKSVNEIALILNRSVDQVKKYCEELQKNKNVKPARRSDEDETRIELFSQADWKLLQQEYTREEISYYEIEYISYRKMFVDLTKTEIKQLHQLIMLDIKIHRHNADLKADMEDIDRMDRLLKQLYSDNNDAPMDINNPNTMMITQLETQRQACRTSKTARQKEVVELLKKHSDLLKDLKSTRDQRIKDVEERGKFIVLLKELEDEARRNSINEVVGLMDISVKEEKHRLGSLHKYADGTVDRPLLTPDTVNLEEEVLFEGGGSSVPTGTN